MTDRHAEFDKNEQSLREREQYARARFHASMDFVFSSQGTEGQVWDAYSSLLTMGETGEFVDAAARILAFRMLALRGEDVTDALEEAGLIVALDN